MALFAHSVGDAQKCLISQIPGGQGIGRARRANLRAKARKPLGSWARLRAVGLPETQGTQSPLSFRAPNGDRAPPGTPCEITGQAGDFKRAPQGSTRDVLRGARDAGARPREHRLLKTVFGAGRRGLPGTSCAVSGTSVRVPANPVF